MGKAVLLKDIAFDITEEFFLVGWNGQFCRLILLDNSPSASVKKER